MNRRIKSIEESNTLDTSMMFDYLKFFPVVIMLLTIIYFGWFWAVGVGLQSKVPDHVKMKINRFKILFFIPVVYIIFISIFVAMSIEGFIENALESDVEQIGQLMTIIVPIHLFAMFCIFHSLYFVAKTIKTVELQREASFSDFISEFFLIWFYPVGVWIVQPKINRMIEEESDELVGW